MAKESGIEYIHEFEVLGHISGHFNNPDISDVTLIVGEQEFAAHRFVLAASKVFRTMLLGENWKESIEKKITLEESSHSEAVFSDFLKFFYTGKLTLTCENVRGIHTLADKYDVPSLKEDCLGFMKDVLTGDHGDAFDSAFEWMQYIETYVPDLMAAWYSAIRRNFMRIGEVQTPNLKHKFTEDQLKNILTIPDATDDIVVEDEHMLIIRIEFLCSTSISTLIPLIRWYNLDTLELELFHQSGDRDPMESACNHAYKVQAERASFLSTARIKRRRMSDGNAELIHVCPCTESNPNCPHINPRFYLGRPFGTLVHGIATNNRIAVEPIDLCDIKAYTEKLIFPGEKVVTKWIIRRCDEYLPALQDPISEVYEVTPAQRHIGRKFSIAIVCVDGEWAHCVHKYTVKYTDVVTSKNRTFIDTEVKPIILQSPLRFDGSWGIEDKHGLGISVLLHK